MYPKNQILAYNDFVPYRDLLKVILRDDKFYEVEQVKKLLENVLKKEVK